MKKTLLAIALATSVGTASAATATMTSATFSMYDPTGAFVGGATDVVGSIGDGAWAVSSNTPFFGLLWTAHTGSTFGPGNYVIDTIEGGVYDITVGAGQVGGHILFNWGATVDIDVVNVWDVAGDIYTSTDIDGDGIPGIGMIDGAFPGFSANFDFVAPSAVPVPAAVWLFGSGLLGLVGVARRRKAA